ncbi:hypothetical protein ACLB2K_036421 [Fragaria x ananassa]
MVVNRSGSIFLVLLLLSSVAAIVSGQNDTVELEDEYWKQRAAEAMRIANASVHPDPEKVTEEFNVKVHDTRRTLRGFKRYEGPCRATNPIDACWRCDAEWADNRQKIVDCSMGFGKKTTGGKGGPIYVVTDGSDDDIVNPKEGTLRYAVTRKRPLWIIFAHSMVIRLQQELMVTCDKTIDGRGANIVIAYGGGITLQYDIQSLPGGMLRDAEDHVGLRTRSDGDGISLFSASNIWIDHVSMARTADGLIDCIMGSTAVTISNGHFTDHNEATRVTGSLLLKAMSQKREYTDESEWKNWNWRSEGDVMENGAFFVESGNPNCAKSTNIEMMLFKPGKLAPQLTSFAGALECFVGRPC